MRCQCWKCKNTGTHVTYNVTEILVCEGCFMKVSGNIDQRWDFGRLEIYKVGFEIGFKDGFKEGLEHGNKS